jgi:SNF2 family DNA or RNA helicase
MTQELFASYPFKVEPYAFQRKILNETALKTAWAYFMEMGTGKSKLVIDSFTLLYYQAEIDTVVIMAKKGEYANWIYDLIPTHLPNELAVETYLFSTLYFRSAPGRRAWESFKRPDKRRLRIFVINVEALITDVGFTALKSIYASSSAVFLVIDESTCVKATTSKRSAEAYKWAAKSKFKRILSGFPIPQSPLDLWGQCLVLGRGLLGHGSYYSFRGEYAEMETMYLGNRSIQTVARYRNLDKLQRVVGQFSTQLLKVDCLDLPPKIYAKRYVDMTPEQTRLYNTLRDEAIITLGSGYELEVVHVLTMITKLHQIACGQLKLAENHYESIPNNRITTTLEILEDYPGKVIIWATYRQTLKDILAAVTEAYGEKAVVSYYGGVSDEDRRYAIKSFQDPSSPVRFFIANPQSAGYSHTLTQAQLVIYYSNGYNLEHRIQSEDRAHRIGQTGAVTYIDLVSRDTIDERIIKILRDKKNIANEVLGIRDLKEWL